MLANIFPNNYIFKRPQYFQGIILFHQNGNQDGQEKFHKLFITKIVFQIIYQGILPSIICIPPASSLSSTAELREVVYIHTLHFLAFVPQHTLPVWLISISEAAVAKVTRAQDMTTSSHMNSLLHLCAHETPPS